MTEKRLKGTAGNMHNALSYINFDVFSADLRREEEMVGMAGFMAGLVPQTRR